MDSCPLQLLLGAPVSKQVLESSLGKEPDAERNVKTIILHSSPSVKYFLKSYSAVLETIYFAIIKTYKAHHLPRQ